MTSPYLDLPLRTEAEVRAKRARGDAHVNAILDAFRPLSMLDVIRRGAETPKQRLDRRLRPR